MEREETDIPRKRKQPSESEESSAPPSYSSKEYWEARYDSKTPTDNPSSEEDPDPFHAWYFTAEELLPLLLPMILGDDNDDSDDDGDDDDRDPEKNNVYEENTDCENPPVQLFETQINGVETIQNKDAKQVQSDSDYKEDNLAINDEIDDCGEIIIKNNVDIDEDKDVEEYDDDDDYDEDGDSTIIRVGLAKSGPISILEIGCGNRPIGRDLACQIPSSDIRKVICVDYSKNVISSMKEEQNLEEKQLPLSYEVADARQLPYRNESFEMILEKGTLDAMLSDEEGNGPKNCRIIVSECARVLTMGGYIIIISHLNARVDSGLQWLNDVIVPGLREGGENCDWQVEVHGGEVSITSDDEEESPESPGPAVYVIEKVGIIIPSKETDGTDQSLPTIPLKFFTH